MSQRRLPLIRSEQVTPEGGGPRLDGLSGVLPARVALQGRVIVVGDALDGDAALGYAARLSTLFSERAAAPAVLLPGVEAVGQRLRALFPPGAALEPIGRATLIEGTWPETLLRPAALTIVAGPLALVACRGRLNVLLCADTPVLRWPEALRALRGSFDLELAGDGAFTAVALADALIARWR